MYPGVIEVKPLKDFKLLLTFDNGEKKIFDVNPYLDTGVFSELKTAAIFNQISVKFDTVEWSNGADLDPEVLYNNGISVDSKSAAAAVAEDSASYE